eukprot:TRINITY_DN11149_c0_g1_i1.p2 TRINITY_DN11149_c0_g1~~TRINITY_DN11149_c0_g1_i1.p2  ORF type:complete len:115 (-),score=23.31 TRINITY_DN11149_c0_g1_i1:531-875(-)
MADVEEDQGIYNSFGFIEVGETPVEGAYVLRRSRSTTDFTIETLIHQQAILEQEVADLKVSFKRFEQKVKRFEAENNKWSVRYSRRIAVFSNLGLSLWIFFNRFSHHVKGNEVD